MAIQKETLKGDTDQLNSALRILISKRTLVTLKMERTWKLMNLCLNVITKAENEPRDKEEVYGWFCAEDKFVLNISKFPDFRSSLKKWFIPAPGIPFPFHIFHNFSSSDVPGLVWHCGKRFPHPLLHDLLTFLYPPFRGRVPSPSEDLTPSDTPSLGSWRTLWAISEHHFQCNIKIQKADNLHLATQWQSLLAVYCPSIRHWTCWNEIQEVENCVNDNNEA